jgi:hypothetical protein
MICGVDWAILAAWAGVVAELVVALVIYWELRAGRTSRAFEALYDKGIYQGRENLYSAFLSTSADCLAEKQAKFLLKIRENKNLWEDCDSQIQQFAKLGYLLRRNWIWRLLPFCRSYGPGEIVESVSHVIAPLAVMLLPYIRLRRQHKGRHWAKHFVGLAVDCLPLTYASGIGLFERALGEKPDMELTPEQLKTTRRELRSLVG